ncbi:sugar ABC transporter ATP-binding protein [Moorella naiadis]|uniref:sugar ABC transporter ATP-binding protein n=1 Tax=Moorella naiadis (nom. illeg.) TaxID=3093670 RepID=UPI003D9CA24D
MRGCKLEFQNIFKSFPGVKALDNVTFTVTPGDVHALIGENGAGKSTLLKILSGDYLPDGGSILLDGQPLELTSPADALAKGISVLYQERQSLPYLSVAENIFLGRLPLKTGQLVDWGELRVKAQQLIAELALDLQPETRLGDLSVAQQQMVEILKAYSRNARVIAFDEPTASLSTREIDPFFALIRRLKAMGMTIIYVSHRMPEIFRICDRITVLRDGKHIRTLAVNEADEQGLVRMMVGRDLKDVFQKKTCYKTGDKLLEVRGLSRQGILQDISFDLYRGEILGIAGLVGAGRTEMVRCLFGADPRDGGSVKLNGQEWKFYSPEDAIKTGLGLCPEDRKSQGLILGLTVRENVTITILKKLSRWSFIKRLQENKITEDYIASLRIKTPSREQKVVNLSGGNQQKVVLAKWLASWPQVLILDEPTRGIDVGAKAEIYELIISLAAQGIGIIMVSSELPEILGLSDRILVLRAGRLVGELKREEASEEKILDLAMRG